MVLWLGLVANVLGGVDLHPLAEFLLCSTSTRSRNFCCARPPPARGIFVVVSKNDSGPAIRGPGGLLCVWEIRKWQGVCGKASMWGGLPRRRPVRRPGRIASRRRSRCLRFGCFLDRTDAQRFFFLVLTQNCLIPVNKSQALLVHIVSVVLHIFLVLPNLPTKSM